MLSMTSDAHAATATIASCSSRATSIVACRPSRTISRPSTSTWRTSAAPAANTTAWSAFSGSVPARRTPSSETVTRSARRAGRDPPGVRPAQAGVPVLGRRPQQRGGGVVSALPARQALVQLDRARLLEEVDHGVGVAAERERGARLRQRAHPADAVGQVALGRRADAAAGAGVAEQRHVGIRQVGGMHGGEARRRARRPRRARPWVCVRRRPGRRRSRPAARTRGRAGGGRAPRPSRQRSRRRRDRPRARCGWRPRSAPTRPSRSASTRSAQALRVAVGEAPLGTDRRLADAAVQVAGVDQGDADAGVRRRGDQRTAHLVGVAVRRAARAVVEVVELADCR